MPLPLVRMPILSSRRVSEIRTGTRKSADRNGDSLAGGLSEKASRYYAG